LPRGQPERSLGLAPTILGSQKHVSRVTRLSHEAVALCSSNLVAVHSAFANGR
jgi:hypothetical protein